MGTGMTTKNARMISLALVMVAGMTGIGFGDLAIAAHGAPVEGLSTLIGMLLVLFASIAFLVDFINSYRKKSEPTTNPLVSEDPNSA